jgi:NiFe hydrogenase small subunit HydA
MQRLPSLLPSAFPPGDVGLSRRDFVRICTTAAAAVGLSGSAAARLAEAAFKLRPSVIWLHFQECTGCTESLLRTSHPALSNVILDLVSLDYSETLFAAAGHQAEEALKAAMTKNAGKYVCVIEGAIPTKDDGVYCMIGGRTAVDIARDVASRAGAVIAIGSCASWGGIPSADPNPTGATGVPQILQGTTVVTIPGCPPNPYNFLGVVLQYAAFGTLPKLDDLGRPLFAYGRTIHEHCPRRAHFDAGRFVEQFGDEGHRLGYCLYKMGCKGPTTYNACSTVRWNEGVSFPIGSGHGCIGCSEDGFWDKGSFYDRLTNIKEFGIEANADRVGATVAVVAGAAVAAHAAVTAIKRARSTKSNEKVEK